jgi:hypothetical protein
MEAETRTHDIKTQMSSCAHDPFKIWRDQKRATTKIVATRKGVMLPASIKGTRVCASYSARVRPGGKIISCYK